MKVMLKKISLLIFGNINQISALFGTVWTNEPLCFSSLKLVYAPSWWLFCNCRYSYVESEFKWYSVFVKFENYRSFVLSYKV